MNSALHKKLRIKGGESIGMINRPKGVESAILPLPIGCKISKSPSKQNDVLFWFVKNQAELESGLDEVLSMMSESNIIWIGYPKGTSGIQTDLSRDNCWGMIMNRKDISYLAFIAYNETWSTFCFRKKNVKDKIRESKVVEREIYQYADSSSKTIILPEDLSKAFAKNKAARTTFEALAFSHRREYIEWIITAKKPETRQNRIQGTIEKLLAGQKNPSNRI